MKMNRLFELFLLLMIITSCKNDDNGLGDVETVPARPLSEVAIENDTEIQAYLNTHFYNYEEFENPPENFDYTIKIDSIEGDNADKVPIIDSDKLSFVDIKVSSNNFQSIPEENDISHRLYFLSVREGGGRNPTLVDSVYIKYEGFRLDDHIFDTNVRWFDLQGTGVIGNSGSFVTGFEEGLTLFKDGDELIENPNGTFRINDSGIGVIFMPSGLAYFNSKEQVGEGYAPIAFKIDLLEANEADHDRDGIPSILEDLDNDGDLFDDNTDEADFPNYLDTDDDNDGTLTIDEDLEPDEDLTVDRDGDGDKTNDVGDGNPLNDDTDGDGIPNYLDTDDTASRKDAN